MIEKIHKLELIRKRKALSYNKLAKEIGIDSLTLRRIIHGETNPSFVTMARLDNYLEKEEI